MHGCNKEVALNIVKGFSPPRIRCCDGVVLEVIPCGVWEHAQNQLRGKRLTCHPIHCLQVERALEPSAVPPCHMERNVPLRQEPCWLQKRPYLPECCTFDGL